MVLTKERCKKLILNVQKRFPELKNIKIHLEIRKLENASMWAKRTFFGKYLVIIDPIKYKDATNKQISGVLPHEFVHFVEYTKMSRFMYFYLGLWYKFSKKFKEKKEKETDRETIRRGFARDLYANRVFRIKTSPPEYKKNVLCFYLIPKEIKKYAMIIGKW